MSQSRQTLRRRWHRVALKPVRDIVPNVVALIETALMERDWPAVAGCVLALEKCNEQVPTEIMEAVLEIHRRFKANSLSDLVDRLAGSAYQNKRRLSLEHAYCDIAEHTDGLERLSSYLLSQVARPYLKRVPEAFCLLGVAFFHQAEEIVEGMKDDKTNSEKQGRKRTTNTTRARNRARALLSRAITAFSKSRELRKRANEVVQEKRKTLAHQDQHHTHGYGYGGSSSEESSESEDSDATKIDYLHLQTETKTSAPHQSSGRNPTSAEPTGTGAEAVLAPSLPEGIVASYLLRICLAEGMPLAKKARARAEALLAEIFEESWKDDDHDDDDDDDDDSDDDGVSEADVVPESKRLRVSSEAPEERGDPFLLRVMLRAAAVYGKKKKKIKKEKDQAQGGAAGASDDEPIDVNKQEEAEDDSVTDTDNATESTADNSHRNMDISTLGMRERLKAALRTGRRGAALRLLRADPLSEEGLAVVLEKEEEEGIKSLVEKTQVIAERLDIHPGGLRAWKALGASLRDLEATGGMPEDVMEEFKERLEWWRRSPLHLHGLDSRERASQNQRPKARRHDVPDRSKLECLQMLMRMLMDGGGGGLAISDISDDASDEEEELARSL